MNKEKAEIKIKNMGTIKLESLKDNNKKEKNIPIKNSRHIKTVSYIEFERLINNRYTVSFLPKRKKVQIFESNAINLISKYRYDVFIKYYYIKEYFERNNFTLAKNIYLDHIKSFNNFYEPDGTKKGSKEFINKFDLLISDIYKNKIINTVIPITKNGEIIDGAHRLAIALYLKLNIKFAIFNLDDMNFSKNYFLNKGFKKEYIELIEKEVVRKI